MRGSLASSRRSDDVIGLLDIGTSKVACVIVAVPQWRAAVGLSEVAVRVLGAGVCPSRGVKSGTVFAPPEAEQAVREAVAQAERGAQTAVESVLLAVACGRLRSATFTAETSVEGRVVEAADIERLMAAAHRHAEREGRTLLHLNCISYRLDGTGGIGHPLGLAGSKLGADLHAVTADDAPLRNMMHVVERAYLSAAGLVPAPYASALAATTGEERQRGVLCLDIGAGTTSLAAFAHGHLLSCEVVPIGASTQPLTWRRRCRLLFTKLNESKRIMCPWQAPRVTTGKASPTRLPTKRPGPRRGRPRARCAPSFASGWCVCSAKLPAGSSARRRRAMPSASS